LTATVCGKLCTIRGLVSDDLSHVIIERSITGKASSAI